MTDEINKTDTNQPAFKKIRDYLEGGWGNREISIGVLATVIEKEGIYTWDRFARFGKANTAAEERILDLLATLCEYENDCYNPPHYNDQHPLDYAACQPDDPYSFFGWSEDELPNFENIAEEHAKAARARPETPQARAGKTKKQNSYLLIIAALCKTQGIVLGERGNAAEIHRFIELAGLSLNEETIRTVLNEVQEAVERAE